MPFASPAPSLESSYRVLRLPTMATGEEIKTRYRKLAREWHPDLFPRGSAGQQLATSHMQALNEAYQRIRTAPLRHRHQPRAPSAPPVGAWAAVHPRPDPFDSDALRGAIVAVRFVFGAAMGLALAFMLTRLAGAALPFRFAWLAFPLAGGWLAARLDDRVWSFLVRPLGRL